MILLFSLIDRFVSTKLQIAKEKVELYQADKVEASPPKQDEAPTENSWLNIVDQRLTEAINQGMFDNLPGQGKPLDFSQDALVPDDKRLAYKLLKNNDLTPDWISERSDIQCDIGKWRTALSTQFARYQREWQSTVGFDEQTRIQALWANYLTRQEEKLQKLNREITALNLQQSIASLEIFHLRLDEELENLNIGCTLD